VITLNDLKELKKTILKLEEIEKFYNVNDYILLAGLIKELIKDGVITPVILSKTNGKDPSLYKRYSLVKKTEDNEEYIKEIKNELYLVHSHSAASNVVTQSSTKGWNYWIDNKDKTLSEVKRHIVEMIKQVKIIVKKN